MLLLPGMNVSLKCRIGSMHNVALLDYMVADLGHPFILFLERCHHCLLFLSFLIYSQDFLLKDCKVLFDGRLRFLHKDGDMLGERLFLGGELPWWLG